MAFFGPDPNWPVSLKDNGDLSEKVCSGLRKMRAAEGTLADPMTLEEVRPICAAFTILGNRFSFYMDKLHSEVLRHTGMTLHERFNALEMYWIAIKELDIMRESLWLLQGKKYRGLCLSQRASMKPLRKLQKSACRMFRFILETERILLVADGRATSSIDVAKRRRSMAFEHYAMMTMLYQFSAVKLSVFFTMPNINTPTILFGVSPPPYGHLPIPPAPPLPPAATPPSYATLSDPCFICWGENEPDYEQESFLEYLKSEGVDPERDFPQTHPEVRMASAGCCSAFFHNACLVRSMKRRRRCPHCQQSLNEAFKVDAIKRSTDELLTKTRMMEEVLLIEHQEYLDTLPPRPDLPEASTTGIELVEE